MSPTKYLKDTGQTCEKYEAQYIKGHYKLPKRAINPYEMGYIPDIVMSLELESKLHDLSSP